MALRMVAPWRIFVTKLLAFSGHMTDLVRHVAEAVDAVLSSEAPCRVLGGAARGVDLLVLEGVQARNIATELVLPYAIGEFCDASVISMSDPDWLVRFNAVYDRATAVRIIPTSGGVHEALDFELTNRRILGGLAQGAADGATARVFGVWD